MKCLTFTLLIVSVFLIAQASALEDSFTLGEL